MKPTAIRVKEAKENKYASFWHDSSGIPHISQRMREKLVKAYRAGLNHRQAAIHCGIAHSDLLEYLSYDEKFRMRAEGLQEHTIIQSKLNLAKDIEKGKTSSSKWLLERKAPEEFSTKQDILLNGNALGESEEEREKQLKEALNSLVDA